ncbi:hypothetical protein [Mesorhizobium tamadayense]
MVLQMKRLANRVPLGIALTPGLRFTTANPDTS